MTDERTWNPGDSRVLPEVAEDAYPPEAVPLDVEPTTAAFLARAVGHQRSITKHFAEMASALVGLSSAADAMSKQLEERESAIEARVRAEVAEEIAVKIESVKQGFDESVYDYGYLDGLTDASKIAAGSSPDTTPEPKP